MPAGSGQTLSKRKHSACALSGLLVALCCLRACGSGARADRGGICGPCPVNCSCSGTPQLRTVNCSNLGLERAPAAAVLPRSVSVLGLSKNHISSLDSSLLDRLPGLRELHLQGNQISALPRGVFCCESLSILDLSNNQITTIEERICDNLCNLTEIDLSGNPFECNCKLFRLLRWLQVKGVQVRHPNSMLCHQPPELHSKPLLNVSRITCPSYAACLEDSSNGGGRSELVIFTSLNAGNFTRQQCNSVCFALYHRYGGLGEHSECLCSTNIEPNLISESECSPDCTDPRVMTMCGWTLARDVFAVEFSLLVTAPPQQSVHQQIQLSAASSVTPITLSWDFGDGSLPLTTAGDGAGSAVHKYGLPGRYIVEVRASAVQKMALTQQEVNLTLPPKLELHCPPLVVANQSLEVTLVSWGGVDLDVNWTIAKEGVEVAKARCPNDGVYHAESSSCFQIFTAELNWTDARLQCLNRGGDLAKVRGEALRSLLAHNVTQERGVWLGLSDMDSPGKLHWVNGSEVEENSPSRPDISPGNACVSLDQDSQISSHLCSSKRVYMCQYTLPVRVQDGGVFILGMPVFPTHSPLHLASAILSSAPQPPKSAIEMLLFPALSFLQEGRLSSLEFVTQELSSQVQVRLQIFRPHCPHQKQHLLLPGCGGLVCAPVAVCVPDDRSNDDPPSCPRLEQWCPFLSSCQPLSSPCHPSSCQNCTHAHYLPPGMWRPLYILQNEVELRLPIGPSAHILDLLVSGGDVIALQHDGGPSSLLQCQSSAQSPWGQPILALNMSKWFWTNNTRQSADSSTNPLPDPELDLEALLQDGVGGWLEEAVCSIRILYVGHSKTQLHGVQLSAGLPQPGLYSLLVSSTGASYPASASCLLQVLPPLALTVLHPPSQNGSIFLQPSSTRLLLRVQSRYATTASRRGSNHSVRFQSECPSEFAFTTLCQPVSSSESGLPGSDPSLFAVLDLNLAAEEQKGSVQVELLAHSEVTEASLVVLIQLEVPLQGLQVEPPPVHRVLMESVVSYTASVTEGSNPTFKWTVDDKPYFTYYNSVLNVIYQHAATYKLTVTASNHVSTLTEHFNVTVDRLQPMADLTVSGVPDVVPQGSNQTLTTSVLVDMTVAATFRWSYGDGGYEEFEFEPPYPPSLLCPDSPNQVLLSKNITYIYSQPGIYTAQVSVSNRYENISQTINMSVYSILTRVDLQTEPQLLLVGKSADFEAHPLPSPYGIHYTWHFGDGSALQTGRRVAHTFKKSGPFRVCVSVNNTISSNEACAKMFVYEEIEDLTAQSSSPTELNTFTEVSARLGSGNNITWSFSMGDGSIYTMSESHMRHKYMKEGNYTVNVTAINAVSSGWTILQVHVFVFQVIRMEPSGCVQERTAVNFQAWISGNASVHLHQWSFGDGSLNETHQGLPRVSHTYQRSGTYHLSLLLSSGVNQATKANFFNWVCVQPVLTKISFNPEKSYYAVGEEIVFQAKAEPEFNYSYKWDFGKGEDLVAHGSSKAVTVYKEIGSYIVTVYIFNNISASNSSSVIKVFMPIGPIFVQHNGTKSNNLTLGDVYSFRTSSLATNVTYTWNFGDGQILTGQNVLHVYNTSGNFNITLKANNIVSENDTILPVAVLAPVRGLTINASSVNVPLNASVDFEAHVEQGDRLRYSWILCDHCTSIPGASTMFYTFRSVGTFNIIVTAENDVASEQASIVLFVQRELEGLQIIREEIKEGSDWNRWCYATNRVLHLQAGLKEGTNMTFLWQITKEQNSWNESGKTVELNFSYPGPCDVVLWAANRLGQLSTNRTIHFIEPAGGVSLHINTNPVAVGALTNLTALVKQGSELQYRWSKEDCDLQWTKPSLTLSFNRPGYEQVTVEVFNEVSSEVVSVVVHVRDLISGLNFTATNVTEQGFAMTGVSVSLQGKVEKGTSVEWTWLLDGKVMTTGWQTSVTFHEPKSVIITLSAANIISRQVVSREFIVQDKIQGLALKASKKLAAINERVEFNISMTSGTDVQLIFSVGGEAKVIPFTYTHVFTRVETYMVNITALNKVSSDWLKFQVEVMEPVNGLAIEGLCKAIPVGVKKWFVASVIKGKPVSFIWNFDLNHHKASRWGKEAHYTPEEPGSLTIHLRGFNNLKGQNITKHIQVQHLLRTASLHAEPRHTFINKTVNLSASVTPKSSQMKCSWDFGDGSTPAYTDGTSVVYVYREQGHYLVQVNCSNLVSWVLAHVEVNITVLECEEPEVQIAQTRLVIWRSQPIVVEANVDLKGCIRYGPQYLWQLFQTSSCKGGVMKGEPLTPGSSREVYLPAEVDVQQLQLSLPKMTLMAGNYSLVFSLSYEGVPLKKAACLQLSVKAAKLKPIIEGGTYRVWSRTQDLQLSAEQSYDPNMDPDSQSLLHYHWECQSTSKGPEHCSTLNFGLGSSGPVLGISGSELEAGVEYTFKLTISKDGVAPESSTQTVLVQNGDIPTVYLECVSCKAQSIYEVSQNSYVYLKGICSNCGGFHHGRWSAVTLHNETLVLDSSSTTTGSDGMNLVLRQGVLRDGDSYVFTLHVTDSSLDGEGAASIMLHYNLPPEGGECHLRGGGESGVLYGDGTTDGWRIRTLQDRVHFNCSGYRDLGVSETPFLYSLLVTRCREEYCEDFCVYKGSNQEHSAFLPPGFSSAQHRVAVSITVEDHQGAANTALNKTIEVWLPEPPPEYTSLPHWLSELTDSQLKKLLEQGDSQKVRELSLALITVLNEYEQSRESTRVSREEHGYRVRVRSNITRALTSLDLSTVSDIQQTSAALAQCTAVSREFICEECQNITLNKLESMLEILQTDTKQGVVTPTEIGDNILNIMGDLIHQVSQSASQSTFHSVYVDSPPPSSAFSTDEELVNMLDSSPAFLEPHPLHVAAKAFSLSSVLMLILMHARVLNEEPLILRGAEIAATGKLADLQSLLCYHGNNSPECQRFSIPRAFNRSLGKAAAGSSIMQLLFQVDSNPFPFNYVPNYAVSTEVASMEFRTENGTQIPISGLDDSLAITVAINNSSSTESGADGSHSGGVPAAANISHCDSVVVRVSSGNTNRRAGLFVQLNFTCLPDPEDEDGRRMLREEPYINAYLHTHERPNRFNCTESKRITLSMTRGSDHRKYTFFLSPESYDTTLDYFINVSTPCHPDSAPAGVHLEVGVFTALCQYFSESEQQWRTDGMVPLAETNSSRAVCRTRHLTSFAAGLFVSSNAVSFRAPESPGGGSLFVLLPCLLGLLSYVVAAAILRKLDQLELRRAAVVPFCGQDGLFKYEIQVKTGWGPGAGTTAHVGISLYGRGGRSGHRHLDSKGAFARNALDIFHIATDSSLGNVWKIRVWHDNKGLSPAWMLQYVLVKDLQTGSSFFFLVEEWLSVDNERTGGRVEMEVEASEEAVLRQLPRLLRCELQRALCESHLWLSLWARPPRSPFTRLQRATCCALLLQLLLLANALWYGAVLDLRFSRAVSRLSPLDGATVGVVTCLVVYPLYLLVMGVFRMSRSECVTVEHVPPQGDQESVEIDDFLDNSMAGSSFLFFNGESNSEETNVDLGTPSLKSVDSWDAPEDEDWPELQSNTSVVGGAGQWGAGMPRLKRAQGSRHLGVDMTFSPQGGAIAQHNKQFTSSDEDLIKHILADGQNFFPQEDESEMADLSSIFGDKTEVILLQKLSDPLPREAFRRDPPKTAFTSNTVVTDVCRPRRFPPWCGRVAMWGSWAAIAVANAISMWVGQGFSHKVATMWILSCLASVLCSFLLLEPLKAFCEAVYFTVCVRRLRPEDQDVLVEFPQVERVVQRVTRVRPPQGFALSQARNQARKIHMLHSMLKNFLFYMFFLMVVLLLNYSDLETAAHSLRLRTQLQRAFQSPERGAVGSRDEVLPWISSTLLQRLLRDSLLLRDTGSVLVGAPRLQQIQDTQAALSWGGEPSVWTRNWFPKRFSESRPEFAGLEADGETPVGLTGMYDSGNEVLLLNRSLQEACSSLQQLQQWRWINHRTHAVILEFSLYNINTNLLAIFTFLFEFPVSDRAQNSLQLDVVSLWPIKGLDMQLLLTIVLLGLVVYFLVRGVLGVLREGHRYLLSAWRLLGLCKLSVAVCVCGLHLSRCVTAGQQWELFLKQPQISFTDFHPLAQKSQLFTVMAAMLLFVLVLKASHQLRFLREWAVFGRALRHSALELLAISSLLMMMLLAFAHVGLLLLHSVLDGYSSFLSTCLSLLRGGKHILLWQHPELSMSGPSCTPALLLHMGFCLCRLVLLWLLVSVLLRNYRRARAELFRPAADLQDHQMVELFLRRLKMWMGLSRTKEFRHKVHFEGLELPPSRSSSTSDCKSLCLPPLDSPDCPPTPDSVDASSEASWRSASSSPCNLTEAPGITHSLMAGLGVGSAVVGGGTSWRERAETEASLRRLLPTLDALLQQLDRVTMATEDLYHFECKLERAHRKRRGARRRQEDNLSGRGQARYSMTGEGWREEKRGGQEKKGKGKMTGRSEPFREGGATAANPKKTPAATPVPFIKTKPASAHTPIARSAVASPPSKPAVDKSTHTTPPPPGNSSFSHLPPKTAMSSRVPTLSPTSTPGPAPGVEDLDPPTDREAVPQSNLFNHPIHTSTLPTRKRKRKAPHLKNKVHPT
ncbi:polycystin-1 precursor [Oryzias latipes]|uniref:Polycystin 1 n=1 Tax=Oryzias latipes TaxID=8090 RepID=B6EX23_ORYLA|nr:polycystin-1 precursor [Oryzias latipes]BAG75152.1 polycystin 1 [Oryzias latipes]